ncbi:hypothetical protein MAC_04615 [Metarhizium acridum CQMa 102]|uniref:Uncharacterized protein n=1 Tax=Metarhizium acridum (strain CQMa 102) TaxID=655827 RepID=E9E417_METAQ|nr:uncharacterized protein MAC_04615 [Metarhizium acridum CQMa 102]EFY89429.1 hypothetical protein MAC_04615 [Metarhizium acridum CQMa 102]
MSSFIPELHSSTPPAPPPKGGSHDVSSISTPTTSSSPPPPPFLPRPLPSDGQIVSAASTPPPLTVSEPIPDPGDGWLPEILRDKSYVFAPTPSLRPQKRKNNAKQRNLLQNARLGGHPRQPGPAQRPSARAHLVARQHQDVAREPLGGAGPKHPAGEAAARRRGAARAPALHDAGAAAGDARPREAVAPEAVRHGPRAGPLLPGLAVPAAGAGGAGAGARVPGHGGELPRGRRGRGRGRRPRVGEGGDGVDSAVSGGKGAVLFEAGEEGEVG